MQQQGQQAQQEQQLAQEALGLARSTLMLQCRFLGRSLLRLQLSPLGGIERLGTDGSVLAYHPKGVLLRWREGPEELARDLLHATVHCLFYHPFVQGVDARLWGLACDIACEDSCLELAGTRLASGHDARRREVLAALSDKLGVLSAEKLYRHFADEGFCGFAPEELSGLFCRDDHALWFSGPRFAVAGEGGQGESSEAAPAFRSVGTAAGQGGQAGGQGDEPADGQEEQHRQGGQREDGGQEESPGERSALGGAENAKEPPGAQRAGATAEPDAAPSGATAEDDGRLQQLRGSWERASKQLQLDLETCSREQGGQEGGLVLKLERVNRRKRDYRAFLRRFAELSEEMRLSDADFDPVFYTYGLATYGNVPLVEPLEFRESRLLREFVVVIDTSASVKGPLVRRFVEETFAILSASASFAEQVNVHIVQCDNRVRADAVLTCAADVQRWLEGFELRGFGGTDFRPAFAYVDGLLQRGELSNVRGLVYFTDGHGTYPATPPPYDVAFVFMGEDAYRPEVPGWAFSLEFDAGDAAAPALLDGQRAQTVQVAGGAAAPREGGERR